MTHKRNEAEIPPTAPLDLTHHISLPCAVVHPDSFAAIAARLGVTVADVRGVLDGARALAQGDDGALRVLSEIELNGACPDVDFDDVTCADAIAHHAPELAHHHVSTAPNRAEVYSSASPPIDELSNTDALCIEIANLADHVQRMRELRAPGILVRALRTNLQRAFEELVAARAHGHTSVEWQPFSELMTGAAASTLCHAPGAAYMAPAAAERATQPRDCFALGSAFIVMYPFASVVIDRAGVVRDAFATSELRPVGGDDERVLFVQGGGPTSWSGYFSPSPCVRDVLGRRWIEGALPPKLPRYVAGAIGDVKWAIVADLERALGYPISPRWLGDQCGGVHMSIDGAYAYDGGSFVVEAATRRPALDMRAFRHDVRSFVRQKGGSFLFIAAPVSDSEDDEEGELKPQLHVVDARGREVCALDDDVAAFGADGRSLVMVSDHQLTVRGIKEGAPLLRIDLRALLPAVAAPPGVEKSELWSNLLTLFGTCEAIAAQSAPALEQALAAACMAPNEAEARAIADALALARTRPRLSAIERLPVTGPWAGT